MKKEIFALALAAAMAFIFTACGSGDNDPADIESLSTVQPSAPESSESQAENDITTLAGWLETDDARLAISDINSQLASSGMTFTLAVDGNILIYEYHLGADLETPPGDAMAAAFGPVIETYKSDIDDVFRSFKSAYDIEPDGARFVFLDAGGSQIYSGEVPNEN